MAAKWLLGIGWVVPGRRILRKSHIPIRGFSGLGSLVAPQGIAEAETVVTARSHTTEPGEVEWGEYRFVR
jgi:hypothetical protein